MRVMAIDYGDVRTGVAISDALGLIAGETYVLTEPSRAELLARLHSLTKEHGVGEIVLGEPKNMDGTLGPRAEKSHAFAESLATETGLAVTLWDERRTTVDAHRILSESGRRGKQRKARVDAVAASLILEGYLASRAHKKGE